MEKKSLIQMVSAAVVVTIIAFLIIEEPDFDFSYHPAPVRLITNSYDEIWHPSADPFKDIRQKLKQDSIERAQKEIFLSLISKDIKRRVWSEDTKPHNRWDYQGSSGDYRHENPLQDDGKGTAVKRRTETKYSYDPKYVW